MFEKKQPLTFQDMHAAMKLEFLELDAKIAESKRAFHVDGVPIPASERSEMLAKAKSLTLELHKMNILGREEKAKAVIFKSINFQSTLIRKIKEEGLEQIIKDAEIESKEALRDAGMLDTYEDKRY
jgi:hypothetical protein